MSNETNAINEKIDRLRADLAATNQALVAMASVLTEEQHARVLQLLAKLSGAKQRSFEKISIPAVQASIPLHQEAESQIYSAIQATRKLGQGS